MGFRRSKNISENLNIHILRTTFGSNQLVMKLCQTSTRSMQLKTNQHDLNATRPDKGEENVILAFSHFPKCPWNVYLECIDEWVHETVGLNQCLLKQEFKILKHLEWYSQTLAICLLESCNICALISTARLSIPLPTQRSNSIQSNPSKHL